MRLTSDHKSSGLILATLIFAAQSAHAQSLPVELVGERRASAVEKVEIEESAVVDGTADIEVIEHRQVRDLNRQTAARLAAAEAKGEAARREHEEAVARARIERRLYEEALARHRAATERWRQDVQRASAKTP